MRLVLGSGLTGFLVGFAVFLRDPYMVDFVLGTLMATAIFSLAAASYSSLKSGKDLHAVASIVVICILMLGTLVLVLPTRHDLCYEENQVYRNPVTGDLKGAGTVCERPPWYYQEVGGEELEKICEDGNVSVRISRICDQVDSPVPG